MESIVQTEQKLAAIMFTDIISFSKMTGNNEKKHYLFSKNIIDYFLINLLNIMGVLLKN